MENLRKQLSRVHDLTCTHSKQAIERQKDNYDVHIAHTSYKVGDIVLLIEERRLPGKCPKLQFPYQSPFVVTRKLK